MPDETGQRLAVFSPHGPSARELIKQALSSVEGVYRALRPGGVFAFPVAAPPPAASRGYWALLGFDLARTDGMP